MKKLFAILAVVMLVVACGGEQKKPMTIEDKFMDYIAQIEKAVEAGDVEQIDALTVAFDEWGTSLNEEDLAKVQKVFEENEDYIFKVMMSCDALMMSSVDECCDECCDIEDEVFDECDCEECDEASDLDEF